MGVRAHYLTGCASGGGIGYIHSHRGSAAEEPSPDRWPAQGRMLVQLNLLAILIALATVSTKPAEAADSAPAEPQRSLTWHLADHVTGSYTARNSLVHAGALGATWLLVESGIDADIQRWAARQSETFSLAFSAPALIGGFAATNLLKAVTGRLPPTPRRPATSTGAAGASASGFCGAASSTAGRRGMR